MNCGEGGGRGRGRFPDPSSRSLAYVVCYLSFLLSVHLSVRPCFCLCACSPVVGNTSSSMSACADFGHPTHPGPHRFSHPAKSKFFSFLSESEGNGKKLDLPPRPKGVAGALKSPKQKPLKSPSTAQIRRKSAANSRKSAQIRPPFCNSAPFCPTRPLGKTMKIAHPSGRQYPP